MSTEQSFVERRFNTRHRARTKVQIRPDGKPTKKCQVINLSANGCAISTEGMGLVKDSYVTLSFMIELGTVIKIHRRDARVAWVKNGVTGFSMFGFNEKRPEKVKV